MSAEASHWYEVEPGEYARSYASRRRAAASVSAADHGWNIRVFPPSGGGGLRDVTLGDLGHAVLLADAVLLDYGVALRAQPDPDPLARAGVRLDVCEAPTAGAVGAWELEAGHESTTSRRAPDGSVAARVRGVGPQQFTAYARLALENAWLTLLGSYSSRAEAGAAADAALVGAGYELPPEPEPRRAELPGSLWVLSLAPGFSTGPLGTEVRHRLRAEGAAHGYVLHALLWDRADSVVVPGNVADACARWLRGCVPGGVEVLRVARAGVAAYDPRYVGRLLDERDSLRGRLRLAGEAAELEQVAGRLTAVAAALRSRSAG